MEYVREVKIAINDEEFDDESDAVAQLELLVKNDNYENNIEVYIDTNKTTYEDSFSAASSAIEYVLSILRWVGE
ncbi:MAG: hypothetical protein NUV47_01245 [Patescibacteria group bacterium]|nr:hypothetical protein [Patescibacteria group bacterium]